MTKPYPFQKEGVKLISKFNGRALLADEMGLGKTIQALVWMRLNKTYPTIVICPASLKYNWEKEALHHINLRSEILSGRTPLPNDEKFKTKHKLIIINYDILTDWLPYLQNLNPKLIICDEVHYLKNMKTNRSRAVRTLSKCKYMIALSGTPLTNRPSELFSVLKMLWPDKYNSFMGFAVKYCKPKKTYWGWTYKGAKNLHKLNEELLQNGMIRRRKKDVLDQLPDKTRSVVPLEINNRKEYKEAENDFISWLKKQSKLKAKKAEKAKQIVRMGYLKRLAAQLKLDQVIDWIDNFLEGSNEKLVVFAIHKTIISKLKDKYKKICLVLDGSTSIKTRHLAVEKFQRNKRSRLFILNIQVGGVGLNITAASNVAIIEIPWTPGELLQAEDRLHRIGQTKGVFCYYLVAQDTIEADLCKLVQDKQRDIETILDGNIQEKSLDIFDQLPLLIAKRKAMNNGKKSKKK